MPPENKGKRIFYILELLLATAALIWASYELRDINNDYVKIVPIYLYLRTFLFYKKKANNI